MSLFTPVRRWQPSFYPFKREKISRRLLAKTERIVKGPLFGCRMCGNCLLQETAFICPMECPKGLRNGPCGGSTPEKCYVDETRKCVWYEIFRRSAKMGREEKLLEVLPPMDWDKAGTETWGEVVRQIRKVGTWKFTGSLFSRDKAKKKEVWESVFRPVRQPEWWNGDSDYHPPAYEGAMTELERQLKEGKFVVTTEITPPLGADTGKLKENIEIVKPYVAAINFTDNSSASPRMSSMACCKTARDLGAEPVLQVAARDTTRSGLQSGIVGANEMGIRNVLCISGDSARIGPSPMGDLQILDVDSIHMLWILRRMRDEAIYLDGRKMKSPPRLFLGAGTSPFAAEPELQAIREQKKLNAGAQYFQTNIIFDPDGLERWLGALDKREILGKAYILAGISPLKSYRMARYLHDEVPGISIPEKIMARMEKAGDAELETGITIALELIDSVKRKTGVSGIHLMTFGREDITKRLIIEGGLEN